jgi:hypothetical protein
LIPKRPQPFSRRHGYRAPDAEITVRHDAPWELREAVQQIAYNMGLTPSTLREIVCGVLLRVPDPGNFSEYPNIHDEVHWLMRDAPWPKVYDIIEAIYRHFAPYPPGWTTEEEGRDKRQFEEETNDFFCERGIGWQLVGGAIETRGPEAFETAVQSATEALGRAGAETARSELHEALQDLSRRPDPDLTGACQHALAALECVAREATGDRTATLGKILERHPELIPKPLDTVVEKAWGFASNKGRHLIEGQSPTYEDIELVVGVAGLVATYLGRKLPTH